MPARAMSSALPPGLRAAGVERCEALSGPGCRAGGCPTRDRWPSGGRPTIDAATGCSTARSARYAPGSQRRRRRARRGPFPIVLGGDCPILLGITCPPEPRRYGCCSGASRLYKPAEPTGEAPQGACTVTDAARIVTDLEAGGRCSATRTGGVGFRDADTPPQKEPAPPQTSRQRPTSVREEVRRAAATPAPSWSDWRPAGSGSTATSSPRRRHHSRRRLPHPRRSDRGGADRRLRTASQRPRTGAATISTPPRPRRKGRPPRRRPGRVSPRKLILEHARSNSRHAKA